MARKALRRIRPIACGLQDLVDGCGRDMTFGALCAQAIECFRNRVLPFLASLLEF